MKQTQKLLSTVLVFLMLLGISEGLLPQKGLPIFGISASAASTAKPKKVKGLTITTANKAKYLKLTWTKQSNAKGYQIFRSTSGKTGTYERIAVVKAAAYGDQNLKNATTYYYKIRAYAKQNGKYVYGAFASANLSTRLTNAYVKKKFIEAYETIQIYNGCPYSAVCQSAYPFEYIENSTGRVLDPYIYSSDELKKVEFTNGVKTKADIKRELSKHFSDQIVDEFLENYVEYDGALYKTWYTVGANSHVDLSKTKVSIKSLQDKKCTAAISTASVFTGSSFVLWDTTTHTLIYQNGRWVFSNNYWGYDGLYMGEY